MGTHECYSNNISNTFSSWRGYVCQPLHTLALALLKWPICTFCTVFKLQALMSWWKALQSASHCTGAGAENLKRKDKALKEPARSGGKYTYSI